MHCWPRDSGISDNPRAQSSCHKNDSNGAGGCCFWFRHVFPRQVRFGYVLNLSHLDPEIGGDSELYCCFVWIRSAMSLLQEHYAPALEQGKQPWIWKDGTVVSKRCKSS